MPRLCDFCRKPYYNLKYGITCTRRCSEEFSRQESLRRGDVLREQLVISSRHKEWRGLLQRSTIRAARKGKETKYSHYLGCPAAQFKTHIDGLFVDGMSWENFGVNGWHIDHIVPVSWFTLDAIGHRKVCFNWLNLRPMWWRQNVSRGNRMTLKEWDALHPDLLERLNAIGFTREPPTQVNW